MRTTLKQTPPHFLSRFLGAGGGAPLSYHSKPHCFFSLPYPFSILPPKLYIESRLCLSPSWDSNKSHITMKRLVRMLCPLGILSMQRDAKETKAPWLLQKHHYISVNVLQKQDEWGQWLLDSFAPTNQMGFYPVTHWIQFLIYTFAPFTHKKQFTLCLFLPAECLQAQMLLILDP